jgi:hypothetical protein
MQYYGPIAGKGEDYNFSCSCGASPEPPYQR